MEYKQYKAMRGELVRVVNAKDTEDDCSMIQYWVDKTQYEFGYAPYICLLQETCLIETDWMRPM